MLVQLYRTILLSCAAALISLVLAFRPIYGELLVHSLSLAGADNFPYFGQMAWVVNVLRMVLVSFTYLQNEDGECEYNEYVRIPLPAGSLLLMEGATQQDWQVGHHFLFDYFVGHCICKTNF